MCFDGCPGDTPFYIEGLEDCYDNCTKTADKHFHVVGEYVCQHECPDGHRYYEHGSNVCYENCSVTAHHYYYHIKDDY